MVNTKEKLLNTAEKLFADQGYYNTSLREITKTASVNLSAVNYHFGSKENLFKDVVERRLIPINNERLRILKTITDEAESENKPVELNRVIHAFVDPLWNLLKSDSKAKNFITLIGSIFQDSDTELRETFMGLMQPVATIFFKHICDGLPGVEQNEIVFRLQLAMGAFHHGLRIMFHPSKIIAWNYNDLKLSEAYYPKIIEFIVKGLND